MIKLSLAEAVKLKSVLNKRIHELEMEMSVIGFVEVEKGKKLPKQLRTLAQVETEIEEIRRDYRLLDKLMYKANIENQIQYGDENLTIVEAIELATQLRARARKYKELGQASKEEYPYAYDDQFTIVKVATFEPEEYRVKALDMERQANRLSNLINSKNYAIALDFDSEKYF